MRFEDYLSEQGVQYEKHTHVTTYTSQGLANAEHVSGFMVAKPVIGKGAGEFAMCVLAAPEHLDLHKAAEVLGEAQVRMATEPEMAELFPDCALGAEPSVGSMFGMKTIMDTGLQDDEFLVMQAGTHTEAIKLRREDWERLCKPVVAPIALA